jgi:hypothetical protein
LWKTLRPRAWPVSECLGEIEKEGGAKGERKEERGRGKEREGGNEGGEREEESKIGKRIKP